MPFNKGGPVTDYKADVGPGWSGLLDQLDAELRAVDPSYQTVQVKEKFARLRVYIEGTPIQADIIGLGVGVSNIRMENSATRDNWRVMQDIVDKYEVLSSEVCENCGQPGRLDDSHYWLKTLCEECSAARDEARKVTWAEVKERMERLTGDRREVQGDLDSGEQQGS